MEFRILKKRLDIGRQFDDFLDKVSEAGLLFKTGIEAYLSGNIESFEKKLRISSKLSMRVMRYVENWKRHCIFKPSFQNRGAMFLSFWKIWMLCLIASREPCGSLTLSGHNCSKS